MCRTCSRDLSYDAVLNAVAQSEGRLPKEIVCLEGPRCRDFVKRLVHPSDSLLFELNVKCKRVQKTRPAAAGSSAAAAAAGDSQSPDENANVEDAYVSLFLCLCAPPAPPA